MTKLLPPKPGVERAPSEAAWRGGVRAGAVLWMLGAAAIHISQVRVHLGEWKPAGWTLLALGVVEGIFALGLLLGRSFLLGLIVIWANVATVWLWAVSRTIGLPVGPEAGIAEAVGRPDLVATSLEVATVIALFALLRSKPGVRSAHRLGPTGLLSIGLLSLATAGVTWFAVQPTAVAGCEGHGASPSLTGPLVPIDGHSILRRGTPVVRARPGDRFGLVVGLLRNCADSTARLTNARVIGTSGDGVTWTRFWVLPPDAARPGSPTSTSELNSRAQPLPGSVEVPPARSDALPNLVLEVSVEGRGRFLGHFWINGVEISYEQGGRSYRSAYASVAGVDFSAG